MIRGLRIGALGVWAGALLMTGATAAIAFPTMRELGPTLPTFGAYPEDHWSIAAGHIMQRVFGISDWTQIACALVVAVSLIAEAASVGWRRLGIAWQVRGAVMLGAVGCSLYSVLVMSPPMNVTLDAYWEAAKAGNVEVAHANKAEFDSDHVLARRLMTATFALVVAALVTTAVGGGTARGARPEEP
jgi:hypothetical protein